MERNIITRAENHKASTTSTTSTTQAGTSGAKTEASPRLYDGAPKATQTAVCDLLKATGENEDEARRRLRAWAKLIKDLVRVRDYMTPERVRDMLRTLGIDPNTITDESGETIETALCAWIHSAPQATGN